MIAPFLVAIGLEQRVVTNEVKLVLCEDLPVGVGGSDAECGLKRPGFQCPRPGIDKGTSTEAGPCRAGSVNGTAFGRNAVEPFH